MLRVLELGCGAGGMSRALLKAGFHVVGVDKFDHPDRPPGVEFIQADWHEVPPGGFGRFDVAFGSSPCPGFSTVRPDKVNRPNSQDFADAECVMAHLKAGAPLYVFENVAGSINFLAPRFGQPFLKTRGHYFWGNCPRFLFGQSNLPRKGWTVKGASGGYLRPKVNDERKRAMIAPAIGEPLARALYAAAKPVCIEVVAAGAGADEPVFLARSLVQGCGGAGFNVLRDEHHHAPGAHAPGPFDDPVLQDEKQVRVLGESQRCHDNSSQLSGISLHLEKSPRQQALLEHLRRIDAAMREARVARVIGAPWRDALS